MGIRRIKAPISGSSSTLKETIYLNRYAGDLVNKWEELQVRNFVTLNPLFSVASNSNKFIISYSGSYSSGSNTSSIREVRIITSYEAKLIEAKGQSGNLLVPTFECKNELYYMYLYSSDNYVFAKVIDSDEKITLSQDINYGFVDGIYFNSCLIFINTHEMLIVKKGESIASNL